MSKSGSEVRNGKNEKHEQFSRMTPAVDFYAAELRRARQSAGLTQDQLAEATHYSSSLVAQVETSRKLPSVEFSEAVDQVLGTDGLLTRLVTDLLRRDSSLPEWFKPWALVEQEATALWTFEPLLVPGLLQTEEYARAVLSFVGDGSAVAPQVSARMARQAVLTRQDPPPPEFVAVIDEGALCRPVGGPLVMAGQLAALATAARQWLVQVVPLSADTYHGLAGPLVIAAVDGTEVVYLDTQLRGYVLGANEAVSEAKRRWNAIRAEALPRGQSVELIERVAQQWRRSRT